MYGSPKALSRDGLLHKRSESVAGPLLSGKANQGSKMEEDEENLNFSGVVQRNQANMTNVNMGILTSPVEIKIQAKDAH